MARVRFTAAGALALATLAACSDVPNAPMAAEDSPLQQIAFSDHEAVVPGEIIVKFKNDAARSRSGLRLNRTGLGGRFSVMSVDVGRERQVAAQLAQDPEVEYAEPNYLRQPSAIDSRLWAFFNPGGLRASFTDGSGFLPTTYSSVLDKDIDNVEGYAAGGAPVVIGSLDTGVDMDHSQFTGRLIAGKDWVSNDNVPEDTDGHGTHTTGTMAGSTVGVAGVSGAAANVKVYVQRVCGPSGCPTSAIVNAIYAAADYPGMVAMNLSLGGSTETTAEKNAINYAVNTKGVLVIAAAGNSGTSKVGCPACDVNAISVSATTWRDGLAYYSQYGKGLDISAPGGELYGDTTDEMGIWSSYLNNGYAYLQGTSMAAPQVTGTAAIVASKTGLRSGALRTRILNTADDIGTAGVDTKFGSGRVNAYRAVTNTTLGSGL
jgi:subtilisin family serine protease